MKKLLLFTIITTLVSCVNYERRPIKQDLSVVTIDSCEYIYREGVGFVGHRGNCKFCKERRKKEYVEIIDSLFYMQE